MKDDYVTIIRYNDVVFELFIFSALLMIYTEFYLTDFLRLL